MGGIAHRGVVAWRDNSAAGKGALRIFLNARYKLIRFYSATGAPADEFYDLVADPYESTDLLRGLLTPVQNANYVALRTATEQLRASP